MPSDDVRSEEKPATRTLTDDDIAVERYVGRRSVLAAVGALAATAAAASVLGASHTAQAKTTDSDPSDTVNNGRGRRPQTTDADPTDRVNNGRRPSGVTDSDPSDRANNGRGPSR